MFEDIEIFLTVANYSNFSKAAEKLNLSQPSVSAHISNLESQLGCKLFYRTSRKVEITPSGVIIKKYFEEIQKTIKKAEKEIEEELSETIRGNLKMGASLTIGEYFLPPVLKTFNFENPLVKVSLTIDNTKKIMEGLRTGEFEVGLIEGNIRNPFEIQHMEVSEICQDELFVVVPKNHLLSAFSSTTVAELAKYPFVLREDGSGTRQVMEDAFIKNGYSNPFNIVMELGSTQAVKAAVDEGLGITIISKWAVRKEVQENVFHLLRINDVTMTRNFSLIYCLNRFHTRAEEAFMQFIKEFCGDRLKMLASENY